MRRRDRREGRRCFEPCGQPTPGAGVSPAEAAPVGDPGEDAAAHLLADDERERARTRPRARPDVEDRAALVLLHRMRVAAERHERDLHDDRLRVRADDGRSSG